MSESDTAVTAFAPVDSRYNGPELEKAVLAFWESRAIFEKTLTQSKGRPRFSFNEGPPTANGKPGIHHVLARSFKDIYPRYKTMRGYHAPRKGGWDTHGLPVEHEIEKRLGIFDKNEIERRVGVAEFTRQCRESVMAYIGEWEEMTRRMGYWVNLDEAYYTLDNDYIESTWNLLKKIWDKGLIYKGYKVVPYDPRIGATLSSHEVAQGYREVEDPSITVRFRLAHQENTALLVWTTTPWTLPSNLLLAVGAEIDYARVAYGNEILLLARTRVEAVFGEEPYKIIDTVKGAELVGLRYQRLFDYLEVERGDPFRVVAADFVSTEDGTGIVHVAPAYGVDDLALGQREGLPVIHGVGLDGNFIAEVTPLAGKFFKQADPVVNQMLTDAGLMFRDEKTLHNYPFGWRTGDPLIYYAKEAWYIATTEVAERMVELNRTINWVPQTIRDGRFGKWLENNIDWALSRERFWGTPLPVWCNDEGECICIGSREQLETVSGQSLKDIDLHRPRVDEITFVKDGKTYTRVPEVIDCWFDSGAMSYAQWHYPFENREEFEQHFPADYICEAIDQTRGWFYTLHAIAALVSDSVAFQNCICLSHIVDAHGKKMSKSQGNIVNPYDVFDTIGADSLRWLFLARTAPEAQKRISVDIVREVAASLVNTFWNTYAFFVLYARLDRVDLGQPVDPAKRPEIDRWILALTHQTVKTATTALDNYDAKGAGEAIEKLVEQLSNWYVRRNRRRFWKSEHGDDKQSAYLTLFECIDLCTRVMAPFMPFLSEAIYRNLYRNVEGAAESVHLTEWPKYDPARLDARLVFEMDVVQQVVGLGRSAREDSRIRVRQPLSRMLIGITDEDARAAMQKHEAQIREELNIKSVEFIERDAGLVGFDIKPNFPTLGKRYGKLMPAIKTALANTPADDRAHIASQVAAGEPFSLLIEGVEVVFEPGDLRVHTTSATGYACARADRLLVALDTSLTEQLVVEGIAREIVRSVQDARKSAGLEISDRIMLTITGSGRVQTALQQHREYLMGETLADSLSADGDFDEGGGNFTAERALGDDHWRLALAKTDEYSPMNILVTGGAGFIGAALCERLLARGERVVAVDNLSSYYEVSLKRARLERLLAHDNFSFEQLDIAERDAIEALFGAHKFDAVIHLAAQAGVRYSLENPAAYIDANLVGFGTILEGCRNSGVAHLVFASSSSVYGASPRLPFSENHAVDHPLSLYAATKKANELMAHAYAHLYRLPCTGLRFFTVYGPWGRPDMAFFKFAGLMLKGAPIPVYNHGNLSRDFTYIDDIVEGIVRVLDTPAQPDPAYDAHAPNPASGDAPFRIYNLGNGGRVELMDYIRALEKALGVKAKYEMLPMQAGDVAATAADMDALSRDFDFTPRTSVEDGLAAFAKWYREYYEAAE